MTLELLAVALPILGGAMAVLLTRSAGHRRAAEAQCDRAQRRCNRLMAELATERSEVSRWKNLYTNTACELDLLRDEQARDANAESPVWEVVRAYHGLHAACDGDAQTRVDQEKRLDSAVEALSEWGRAKQVAASATGGTT